MSLSGSVVMSLVVLGILDHPQVAVPVFSVVSCLVLCMLMLFLLCMLFPMIDVLGSWWGKGKGGVCGLVVVWIEISLGSGFADPLDRDQLRKLLLEVIDLWKLLSEGD